MTPTEAIEKLKDHNCKCCPRAKADSNACKSCEIQYAIAAINILKKETFRHE